MIFCRPPVLPPFELMALYVNDFSAFCVAFLLICTSFEMVCSMAGVNGALSSCNACLDSVDVSPNSCRKATNAICCSVIAIAR